MSDRIAQLRAEILDRQLEITRLQSEAGHVGHEQYESEGDETFYPRRGCLECNIWYEQPRLRRP